MTVRRSEMMGSSTEPTVLDKGDTPPHRGRVGQAPAASDKSEAIRFAGNLPLFSPLAHHEMQQPRRLFFLGTRAAGAKNGGRFLREFSLHEEIAESGMRRVRVRSRQHHFGVTGQFNDSRDAANDW